MHYDKALTKRHSIRALAGMVGPVLFVGIFLIEGWLRNGYDPLSMYVSALSLGPLGWIQIANFIVFGTLLLIFTSGVADEFKKGKASKAGPILLLISSIGFFFSGPFVMDPMSTLPGDMSVHGRIHGILGGIVFTLMPVICFVFLRRFSDDPKWKSLKWPTLVFAVMITAADVLFSVITKSPSLYPSFHGWFGFLQRMVLIPFMIWLFIFALSLYQRDK